MMQRREFLAFSMAAAALWTTLKSSPAGAGESASANDPLLDRVCDLVIPATDTPGALAVGVARFMSAAMSRSIAGTVPEDRHRLEELLRKAAGGESFLNLSQAKQLEVLIRVDQGAYVDRNSLWARMKGLVLIGYYTSEVGCTQELQYQLVPGRFDPDIPLKPGDRASANDWTGQRFG